MPPDSVKRLEIWSEAMELVQVVYRTSSAWPRDEIYGLTSQVRKAAVSVPSNVAEGVGRGTPAEGAHFAQIALGSLYELDTLWQIATGLRYPGTQSPAGFEQRLTSLSRKISSFIRYKKLRK